MNKTKKNTRKPLTAILAAALVMILTAALPAGLGAQNILSVFSGSSAQKTSGPLVGFTYSPVAPTAGTSVQFTGASSSSIDSWTWDFGDGSTSTVQSPGHIFSAKGFYRVTLTGKKGTATARAKKTIIVLTASSANAPTSSSTPVTASFSYSPASPLTSQSVQFTDASTGSPTSWTWSFGDGATSTSENPTHSYATAGTYTVTLAAANTSGSASTTQTLTVHDRVTAAFGYSPSSPTAGGAVQFSDASTGAPTSWTWSFGDGSTSTSENPIHSYATAGTYTVTLTVASSYSSASVSKSLTVKAGVSAVFTYSPSSPSVNGLVQFTDASTGGPTSWTWSFGDGSTSTSENPTHTFTSVGSFTVTLTAADASTSSSASHTVTVSSGLTAAFSFSPSSPTAAQTVAFTDASTGSPTSWTWDFGDGSASTSENPSHSYDAAGSYAVKLTIANDYGSASVSKSLTVSSSAGTITAASPAYADVVAAISAASAGGTVSVPAGTATWTSQLVITKGIKLVGAGQGSTVITSGYSPSSSDSVFNTASYLISYDPSSPAANEPFRISGFTFVLNNTCSWLMMANTTTTAINQIRIDHNTVTNDGGDWHDILIHIYGTIYGVVDDNDFGTGYMRCNGLDSVTWTNLSFDFGTADNMYFEDNTFASPDTMFFYGEMGGRYCVRYNTFDGTGSSNGLYPFSDMHGNMTSSGHNATMGAEIYNNTITCNKGVCMMDQRGGKALIFGNNIVTSSSVWTKVREEYLDSLTPPADDVVSGQPQHVSGSYYWNNLKNGSSLFNPYVAGTVDYGGTIGAVPQENVDFWGQATAFDGTTGVGVGLLSARPTTCTKGVAYWATDMNILYVATAANTWTALFTPYTYPHPLRSTLN